MKYEVKQFDPSLKWPDGLTALLATTHSAEVQMLPLTEEQIMHHQCHTGAFTETGMLVGYIAVTFPSVGEVGALVVNQDHRKHGLGHQLVKAVTSVAVEQGIRPIAFCNPLSAPLFASSGYQPLETACVPEEALEFCVDCKKKPDDGGCCDVVYALPSEVEVVL